MRGLGEESLVRPGKIQILRAHPTSPASAIKAVAPPLMHKPAPSASANRGGGGAGFPALAGPFGRHERMVSLTNVVPAFRKPSLPAAAFVRSMRRPPTKGPRSLIRTTTSRPFLTFVTFTRVPNGSERCAAVMSFGSHGSPEAVIEVSAYQEALPVCAAASS